MIFKVNGVTIKDSNNNTIKNTVNNGVATYTYTVPKGMAAVYKNGTVRDYTVSAVFSSPDYTSVKTTTDAKFNVERAPVTIQTSSIVYDSSAKTITIKGNIKDSKGNNVEGTNKVNVKLNGVSVKNSLGNAITYTVTNGIISIRISLAKEINLNDVTLVTGATTVYEGYRTTITDITRV